MSNASTLLLGLEGIVVDTVHRNLVKRANQTVEAVRRRTTWDSRGHRGRKADREWLHRRRLLRAAERLADTQRDRLVAALAARIAKELH